MKKKFLTGLLSLFMLFGLLSPVGAQASNEIEEGLIPALSDAFSADENVLNNHLLKMGFNDSEISDIPVDMKREISSKDGKKAASQKLDTTITVTDENGNEIIDRNSASVVMAANIKPTLSGYAVYSGTSNNGKELIYEVYSTYRWNGTPDYFYTDNLGMAWQSNATPTGTPNGQHTIGGNTYSNKVDREEVSGTAWLVDLRMGGSNTVQSGWGRQQLRYPASQDGMNTAIAVGYSHRWLPAWTTNVSLSFGYVGFSGNGKTDYSGRFNFVI
ncbi:hypothetical protein D3C74_264330 [compost metagenome]